MRLVCMSLLIYVYSSGFCMCRENLHYGCAVCSLCSTRGGGEGLMAVGCGVVLYIETSVSGGVRENDTPRIGY
jgi:hypothetical protein